MGIENSPDVVDSDRAERKRTTIAALHGAGIHLSEIARVTGLQRTSVSWIIEQRLNHDENLQDIYKAFRDEVRPLIRSILAKAFAHLDLKLSRRAKDTSITDLVRVIKEVGTVAGFFDGGQSAAPGGKVTARIDTTDPNVVQNVMEAMKKEREAKVIEVSKLGDTGS